MEPKSKMFFHLPMRTEVTMELRSKMFLHQLIRTEVIMEPRRRDKRRKEPRNYTTLYSCTVPRAATNDHVFVLLYLTLSPTRVN